MARRLLRPVAIWHQQWRGTNAISTALAEGNAVVVHGGEHFLERNGFLTCTATRSPTLEKLLGIPGLRTWRVAKFPLLWCYFERAHHLDVVRLLGERRDIAAILGDEFASN